MNIFTIGSGFVAQHLPYPIISDRLQANQSNILSVIDKYKPDVLINCIGKTGRPNVDWCEVNKEETIEANVTIPIMLANVCSKKRIHLIHIGSGCIYFGCSPHIVTKYSDGHYGGFNVIDEGWKESDFANPDSFYSKTKYACDLAISSMDKVTVLRIRMPISTKNNPRNFINKVRGYRQVIDIPNSMTFISDLVRCVDWAIKNYKTGIYHVTNPQPLTAAQVMNEYKKYVPDHSFSIISGEELNRLTKAKRSNCLLNTDKLTSSGFIMTPSQEALELCMAEYIKNI